MALTQIILDRQAAARVFPFGGAGAGQDALVTINKGTASLSTVVLDVKGSQNIGGDLNLTGNLNITGNINETSVTNLAVVDLTIRTNKGGTTAGAAGAGLQIEGDSAALIGAITYNAASASKFQIGDGTTQRDIADISSVQTLTNKSIVASQLTGQVSITQGGTGQGSAAAGFDALSGMTTLGDILYGGAAGTRTRLAGDTSNTRKFLRSLSAGAVASAPVWDTLLAADIPSLAASIITSGILTSVVGGTGNGFTKFSGPSASEKTFTLPNANATILTDNALVTVPQGGTGVGTLTGVVLGNGVGAFTAVSILTSVNGGTGNGFTKFTGPAAAEKTFTLPNASAVILTDNALVSVAQGGTGINTTTVNGVLLGGTTGTGAFQNAGTGATAGFVLTSNGTGVAPTWQVVSASAFNRRTTVTGTQDSANKVFTLGNAVSAASEHVTLNGQTLTPGSSNDYVISGTTLTFQAAITAPAATDVIQVWGNY